MCVFVFLVCFAVVSRAVFVLLCLSVFLVVRFAVMFYVGGCGNMCVYVLVAL